MFLSMWIDGMIHPTLSARARDTGHQQKMVNRGGERPTRLVSKLMERHLTPAILNRDDTDTKAFSASAVSSNDRTASSSCLMTAPCVNNCARTCKYNACQPGSLQRHQTAPAQARSIVWVEQHPIDEIKARQTMCWHRTRLRRHSQK